MGGMPKGAAWAAPNSARAAERAAVSRSARGTKPHSAKAARLSRSDWSVSAAPAT